MHLAVIFPARHNAASTVLVDTVGSIMQPRTGHVPGGEAEIEVS